MIVTFAGPMEVLVRKPPVFTVEPEPLYQRKVRLEPNLYGLTTKKIKITKTMFRTKTGFIT